MTVSLFLDDKKIMAAMKRMTRSVITDQIRQFLVSRKKIGVGRSHLGKK